MMLARSDISSSLNLDKKEGDLTLDLR